MCMCVGGLKNSVWGGGINKSCRMTGSPELCLANNRLVSLSLESGQPGTNCNRNTSGFILNLNVSLITYQKLQGLSLGEVHFFNAKNLNISLSQNGKEYEYI